MKKRAHWHSTPPGSGYGFTAVLMVKTRPACNQRKSLDLQLSDLDFFAPTSLPVHSTVALLEELAVSAPPNNSRNDESLLYFDCEEESSNVPAASLAPSLQSLQLGDDDEWPRLESNPPTLAELTRSTVRRLQPAHEEFVVQRSTRPPMQRRRGGQVNAESGIVPSIAKTDRPRSVIRRPPSRARCEHDLARSLEGLQLRPRRSGGSGGGEGFSAIM